MIVAGKVGLDWDWGGPGLGEEEGGADGLVVELGAQEGGGEERVAC